MKYHCDTRGRCSMRLEALWDAVKEWAVREGKEYVNSYGVVGVAPT